MRGTWVTLLSTDSYYGGVQNLYDSYLKVNSKYPFIVMAYDDLSRFTFEKLDAAQIPYKIVSARYYKGVSKQAKNYDSTAGKFYAFLLDVDVFAFIDADQVFLQNIDYLLDEGKEHYFKVIRNFCGYTDIHGCIFIAKPSQEKFDWATTFEPDVGDDEEVLKLLVQKWHPDIIDWYWKWNHENGILWHDLTLNGDRKYWLRESFSTCGSILKFLQQKREHGETLAPPDLIYPELVDPQRLAKYDIT